MLDKGPLYVLPVPRGRPLTQHLALPDHDQKCEGGAERQDSSHDEAPLLPHVGIPCGNAIRQGKPERVADDGDGGGGVAANVFETVNIVRQRDRPASDTAKGQDTKSNGQARPVDLIVRANTPDDQADA